MANILGFGDVLAAQYGRSNGLNDGYFGYSTLPIRNEKGPYEEAAPVLTSAAELSDFIRDRTAAWKLHLERFRRQRHGATPGGTAASRPGHHRAPRH
jgi:hypothetical protein